MKAPYEQHPLHAPLVEAVEQLSKDLVSNQ